MENYQPQFLKAGLFEKWFKSHKKIYDVIYGRPRNSLRDMNGIFFQFCYGPDYKEEYKRLSKTYLQAGLYIVVISMLLMLLLRLIFYCWNTGVKCDISKNSHNNDNNNLCCWYCCLSYWCFCWGLFCHWNILHISKNSSK